jgi:SAM-dependent methyltransferase
MESYMSRIIQTYRRLRPNPSRIYLRRFLMEAFAECSPSARVLDAGAGEGRYAELFAQHTYHAVDLCLGSIDCSHVSYVSNLEAIAVRDASYDMVVCTQVLEHVPDPLLVLRELNRALKPGGSLWLTVPFFFAEHMQPYDFYRYTQFGLRHLLEQAGFEVRRIQRLEGYLGTLAYQLESAARYLPILPARSGGLVSWIVAVASLFLKPLFFLTYLFLAAADSTYKVHGAYSKNYAVVACKPTTQQVSQSLQTADVYTDIRVS